MAAIDYRQLQAPEQVSTDLPSSGAVARAEELRRTFQEFEGISANVYNKAATQAGAIAGAASGNTGHPQYKEGLRRFSAYAQAFNNAATGAYAVQAEAQADDAAARLRVEANNDPAHFQATYSAVRDAVVKNAPKQAQPVLMELYNKRLAAGMAAISGDQATEIRNTQRATYDEGVARGVSRVALLQGSDNPQDQLAGHDEQVKLSLLIAGGVKDGLYSTAEGQAMQINAMRAITGQVFETQVDRELARPDGDVVKLLDNFRKAHEANLADPTQPVVLSEDEFGKLMDTAVHKMQQQRSIDAIGRADGKTAEQLRFENGDRVYTDRALRGVSTASELAKAQLAGDLKPETARALAVLISQGPVLRSDPRAFLAASQDPHLLDMTTTEIAALPNISNADKIKLGQQAEHARANWEGTPAAKQAKGAIAAALKIPAGGSTAGLSDEERKAYVDANQELITLVNATTPSEREAALPTLAQQVIQHTRQKLAQAQVQELLQFKASTLATHGPGSSEEWDAKKLEKYMKDKDAAIAAAQAAAKGP